MSYVVLRNVSKHYGATQAVRSAAFGVERGEFFSLLGPSGCGKTTILRMIAGFVRPASGTIAIGDEDVTYLPPERRGIGIVFQNYAIFPHMSVFDNIAFGLRMRKVPRDEIERKVQAALRQVGLAGYERRFRREMSGGEQQRVALARVLVTEPQILLLDEPLSALDKKMREEMKYWIKDLQHELGITTIYVTHDQSEALTMSNRIAVMNNGAVRQIGTPTEIYEHPINRFVTDFIGESNILPGQVISAEGDLVRVMLAAFELLAPRRNGLAAGQQVAIAVRPEHIVLGQEAEAAGVNRMTARLRNEIYQGAFIRYELELGAERIVVEVQNRHGRQALALGSEITLGWQVGSATILTD